MDDSVFAGLVSGSVQTIVGHPLDTMKVWRQQNGTATPCKLFKGLKYPLITSSITTSIMFTSYNWMAQHNKYITSNQWLDAIGGAFSGIFTGICAAPIDKYKIQQQMNIQTTRYGVLSCILREIPANAIYFGSYAHFRSKNRSVLESGALAGGLSWLLTYPLDVIKTQVQSGKVDNIRQAIHNIRTGTTSITNGIGLCVSRALLVNGVGFVVYEECVKLLTQYA